VSAAAQQPPVAGGRRLAWLDALRGIAALCVVFDHLGLHVLQSSRIAVFHWVDTGKFGVFVFFLISGYIVPASLERKGSVRAFWVSRVCRLYPLYLVALAGAVALWAVGLGSLRGTARHPGTAAIGHLLMLSNLLGGPNAIVVIWTLSYEMAFYVLLTALFVAGWHRRSGTWAMVFAVAAVAVGGVLPTAALSQGVPGRRAVTLLTAVLVAGGLAVAAWRGGRPRLAGAGLAAVTVLVLIVFNGRFIPPWEELLILALMFTGTVVYRAERGQIPGPQALAVAVTVFVLAVAAGLWYGPPGDRLWLGLVGWQDEWVGTLAAAGLTFAAGLACRRRRVPAGLAWLGLVSYSVYLLHPLLLRAYAQLPVSRRVHSLPGQVLVAVTFVAAVLVLSAVTYRLVEAPMQRWGRTAARWLERRLGPDQPPDRSRSAAVEAGAR